MSDKKISQLSNASLPLAGTEVLPVVQSGSTVKVSSDDLTVKNVRSNATNGILQVTGPAAGSTRVVTVPDANFTVARTDAGQTFTGVQSFTSPQITTGINDANGNELISLVSTASAVNEITVTNSASGTGPSISATGGDAGIRLRLIPKAGGAVEIGNLRSAIFNKFGTTATLAQNATEAIYDTSGFAGVFLVTVTQSDQGIGWRNAAIAFFSGASWNVTTLVVANVTVTGSGNNIILTNTNASSQAFRYAVLRLIS
jgi:hypothetical protein